MIAQVAKAIAAALTTLAATLGTSAAQGGISGSELAVAVIGALGAAAAVWSVPNAAPAVSGG